MIVLPIVARGREKGTLAGHKRPKTFKSITSFFGRSQPLGDAVYTNIIQTVYRVPRRTAAHESQRWADDKRTRFEMPNAICAYVQVLRDDNSISIVVVALRARLCKRPLRSLIGKTISFLQLIRTLVFSNRLRLEAINTVSYMPFRPRILKKRIGRFH